MGAQRQLIVLHFVATETNELPTPVLVSVSSKDILSHSYKCHWGAQAITLWVECTGTPSMVCCSVTQFPFGGQCRYRVQPTFQKFPVLGFLKKNFWWLKLGPCKREQILSKLKTLKLPLLHTEKVIKLFPRIMKAYLHMSVCPWSSFQSPHYKLWLAVLEDDILCCICKWCFSLPGIHFLLCNHSQEEWVHHTNGGLKTSKLVHITK